MALPGSKWNGNIRLLGNIWSSESTNQQKVIDIQTDATLDPGASPTTGDRYIIENSAALNANFGSIAGIGDDDIVEYDGTNFVVVWDASVQGAGACAYDLDSSTEYCYNGSEWSTAASPSGGDGITFNGGSNRYDLDLSNTDPGLELTASDGTGELRLSSQGNGIAGGAGSLLSVDPADEVAGSRAAVYIGADGVGIDLDNTTIEHSSSTLQLKDAGVSSAKLADDSVTAAKLNADTAGLGLTQAAGGELDVNVDDTTVEISTDTLQVKDAGISTAKLADDSVSAAKLNSDTAGLGLSQAAGGELDVNVDDASIEINVDTLRVKASGIGSTELADDAVTSAKLATDSVGDDAINYSDIKMRSAAATDPFTASLTRTFTHNWSTTDVLVEVIDSVTGETCYVESVIRTSNAVAITLNQTPTNSLRILLREVKADQTTLVVS